MLGFKPFHTATCCLKGIEVLIMLTTTTPWLYSSPQRSNYL